MLTTYRLQLQSKTDREQMQNHDTTINHHDTTINLNSVNNQRITSQETRNKRLETMANTWEESNIAKGATHKNNRNKRNIDNLDTQIINSLKPKLQSFINISLSLPRA